MDPPREVTRVLFVDDDEDIRAASRQTLDLGGFDVEALASAERALDRLSRGYEGIVISDIRMPRMDGIAFLRAAREIDAEIPFVLISGHADVPLAVEAMRLGAYDFVEKPFAANRILEVAGRAAEKRRLTLENRVLRAELSRRDDLEAQLVGRAPVMVALRQRIRTIAATDADVLVNGETGTGKEIAARAIHSLSERAGRPFIAINCGALPADLIESELFGHEQGAFPGAHRARVGKFEHARGGTIFLDEIESMPISLQVKLLRVIQERVIERLGSNEPVPLDVRFLAATKIDLEAAAAAGIFRPDLYYRLAVVSLRMPPLRERVEDAPRLFMTLVGEAATRYRRPQPDVGAEDLAAVARRDWPGNVRELRNAADRFVLGLGLDPDEAPVEARSGSLAQRAEVFEKSVLAAELSARGGSLKATYEALGLSRKTLWEKMQKHGLRREDFGAADD